MDHATIEDKWDLFRKKILTKETNEIEIELYRAIFMSGAISMFEIQTELVINLSYSNKSSKEKANILQNIIQKMYFDAGKKRNQNE